MTTPQAIFFAVTPVILVLVYNEYRAWRWRKRNNIKVDWWRWGR